MHTKAAFRQDQNLVTEKLGLIFFRLSLQITKCKRGGKTKKYQIRQAVNQL